jgi:hypothetical protein
MIQIESEVINETMKPLCCIHTESFYTIFSYFNKEIVYHIYIELMLVPYAYGTIITHETMVPKGAINSMT